MKKTATMERLPHEMMVEILSWLPAKSVLRFRCVSKPCCASISDSGFVKLHLSRATERDSSSLLLVSNNNNNRDDPDYYSISHFSKTDMYSMDEGNSFYNPKKIGIPFDEFRVLGSCDGIVCLCTFYAVCLLNPSTREYKLVGSDSWTAVYHLPQNVVIAYGFGYDPINHDFAIVHIVYPNTSDSSSTDFDVEINVYPLCVTSGSTLIRCTTPYEIMNGENGGVYVKGALHWIALHTDIGTESIVSFDITEKVFHEVPPPESVDKNAYLSVGVSQGKLCMISCVTEQMSTDMWMMNTYGVRESWSKLYSIDQTHTYLVVNGDYLFFTINDEVLLQNSTDCILYDPKQKKAKDLGIHVAFDLTGLDMIVSHTSSLMPLQSGTMLVSIVEVQGGEQMKSEGVI